MIDWIVAQRIATFVAGTGERERADRRPDRTRRRVRGARGRLHRAEAGPAAAAARRGSAASEWVSSNVQSMRALLDPVLERAGAASARCVQPSQIGMGVVLSTEVGVVIGYLAQRVLGQYELVLLDEAAADRPPRLLFVLPNLGEAVRAFGAEETGVHDLGDAARGHARRAVRRGAVAPGHLAGLVREVVKIAEVRVDAPARAPAAERRRGKRGWPACGAATSCRS